MPSEKDLIKIISDITKSKYIGDDAAVLDLDQGKYCFALDSFIEGTHFSQEYFSPFDIGWKSLAINVSDMVAMGAYPLYTLVGLNLATDLQNKETWVKNFYEGFQACAKKFADIKILGGDLCVDQSHNHISVAIIGKTQKVFYRNSAKVGDVISVSGKFGNSANFLATRNIIDKGYHLRPSPRLDLLDSLANLPRAALIDASDGLAKALMEIAIQSKVDIQIDLDSVPKDPHIDMDLLLYGGEDYELVLASEKALPGFYPIGRVLKTNSEAKIFDAKLIQIPINQGFEHF